MQPGGLEMQSYPCILKQGQAEERSRTFDSQFFYEIAFFPTKNQKIGKGWENQEKVVTEHCVLTSTLVLKNTLKSQ